MLVHHFTLTADVKSENNMSHPVATHDRENEREEDSKFAPRKKVAKKMPIKLISKGEIRKFRRSQSDFNKTMRNFGK